MRKKRFFPLSICDTSIIIFVLYTKNNTRTFVKDCFREKKTNILEVKNVYFISELQLKKKTIFCFGGIAL